MTGFTLFVRNVIMARYTVYLAVGNTLYWKFMFGYYGERVYLYWGYSKWIKKMGIYSWYIKDKCTPTILVTKEKYNIQQPIIAQVNVKQVG